MCAEPGDSKAKQQGGQAVGTELNDEAGCNILRLIAEIGPEGHGSENALASEIDRVAFGVRPYRLHHRPGVFELTDWLRQNRVREPAPHEQNDAADGGSQNQEFRVHNTSN